MATLKCRKPPKKRDYKHSGDNRKERQKYYNLTAWQTVRNLYIQEHPICEECLKTNGVIKEAVHVHHKISFMKGGSDEGKFELLTDVNNLESLCLECHLKKHQK